MGRESYKVLIILLCVLASCTKDKPATHVVIIPSDKAGVYVACEGQYPHPDAGLYLYKPAADSVFGDLYASINGQPLGEVFQDMVHIGNYYFLVINNSDKITVINTADLKLVTNISIRQPRYILPLSNNRAYVSTMYSNKVFIINTASFTVIDSMLMPAANPEGMCLLDSSAFICCWDTANQYLFKINTSTNTLTQTIRVAGPAPQQVVTDKDGLLWVFSGNQPQGKTAALTHIDTYTGDILRSYNFPSTTNPIKPAFNPAKDTLYFIEANFNSSAADNGVYRMSIYETTLPAQPFVAALANQYFWALGIDPVSGLIYIGDPRGFNQQGSVLVYRSDATLTSTYKVGIGPSMFCFEN